ncbi:MAG TPA: beta-L-arabinofuranosidase domain-containing protein [Verrucomicrobiae bacterium]|nr:beta-L-arabinofuranosidase domain-containing protein [Verrucomicrobiae bacterium]
MNIKYIFTSSALVFFALLTCGDVKKTAVIQAQPFPLKDVRLLDGPFRDAMLRDGNYLLSLEPDRLLSWFRKEAGLQPKGEVYGGWESQGIAGHTLGHYLSACSHMYASTGDERFRARINYIVNELAECQRANGNGYVAAIPNGKKVFAEIAQGKVDSQDFGLNGGWVPWYTLHKEFAGLIDAYQLCDNAQALEVVANLANWADATTKNLTSAQWQKMLVCEQGGMNEALANLYAITGDTNYLTLAEKFYHKAVLDPLANGEDILNGLHSNMQIPKVIGAARIYELTGDEHYADIARFFWNDVALHRSFVIGGNGDAEHFFPTNEFAKHLDAETAETCCTYNMLKLTRHLFEWKPDATEMDFYERALYNDILASQDPDTGMFTYFMSLKPGHFKTFSTPENSFWCCVGTGMENHAKYANTLYFHGDNSLYVNLFIASELSWPEKKLVVRQETKFPGSDKTELNFKCKNPVQLALKIRWPKWAEKISVRVNGKKQKISGSPESYVTLNREWKNGDKVEIQLPMKLHILPLPGSSNIIAVLYGPIVLAGELGTNGMPSPYATNQLDFVKVPDPQVPVFVADNNQSLLKHIHPTGEPLVFQTKNLGRPNDITLIPFYKLNHQRYSVYWHLLNPADWKKSSSEANRETGSSLQTLNSN